MEQIVVALSPFTRRCRSIGVSHNAHALARGLELGEHVLVHDPVAEQHFCAVVADVQCGTTDTSYRLELGGRITAEEAADWLAPWHDEDRLTPRDLVELLAGLRRGEREIADALTELSTR